MRIESLIKRPKGTEITLGQNTYHFVPDDEGRHVAVVENEAHILSLLAIKEGFRSLDGAPSPAAAVLQSIEGYYFIVRGPQDMEALVAWASAIPEMQQEPNEFLSLTDKVASGEACLGGYAFPEEIPPEPPAHSPAPAGTIFPIDHDQSEDGHAAIAEEAGTGGTGEGGAGADSPDEDDVIDDEDKDEDIDPTPLDREALALAYSELFGHRPNGKWSAEKIQSVLDEALGEA